MLLLRIKGHTHYQDLCVGSPFGDCRELKQYPEPLSYFVPGFSNSSVVPPLEEKYHFCRLRPNLHDFCTEFYGPKYLYNSNINL